SAEQIAAFRGKPENICSLRACRRRPCAIVESGPYRFTRNPIYLGMFLGLIGLALAFDNLWLLMMLVPFAPVIHYGAVAREESYLERKFGDAYRGYRSRVRRWL